jgi:hypothetical protein
MPYGWRGFTFRASAPSTAVQLHLSDPGYTERLAAFLESLGQTAIVSAPGDLELEGDVTEAELAIYLRVWHVLYPEAVVVLRR